jgi:hypothetical protein
LRGLDFAELGRSLLAAILSGGVLAGLRLLLPSRLSKPAELAVLLVSAGIWLGLCWAVLQASGSSLPGQLARRVRGRGALGRA